MNPLSVIRNKVMPDPDAEYIASRMQQAREGRARQVKMAADGLPPRTVRRALPNVGKRGRRGARARARILRAAARYGTVRSKAS